jgi:hypothetical protein
MSTEISTNTGPSRGLSLAQNDELSFDALIGMGDKLRRTGFLPSHIKDGIAFAAIVLMGRERGIGTMSACQRFAFIKGVPTEKADSQLARFKSCGGKSQFRELTETKAVLWLRHPNGDEHVETFTFDDAKRAGLASNDNYAKHPKAMLRSRAITAGLKSVGWEGAVGIYDPDELADTSSAHVSPPVTVTQPEQTPEPKAVRAASAEDMVKALKAINTTRDIGKLGDFLSTVNERYEAGFYTVNQADELRNTIDNAVALLNEREEVTA